MNSILNWARPHPVFVFSFIQCTPKTSSSVKYFTVVTLINNRNIMGYDLRVLYCHKTIFVYLIMKKFLNSHLTGHCCLWEALQWWCFMWQDTTTSYCLCRYVNTFSLLTTLFYILCTSPIANSIMAKLTNQFIQTRLRTIDWLQLFTWLWWWLSPSCRQQSISELPSPEWSDYTMKSLLWEPFHDDPRFKCMHCHFLLLLIMFFLFYYH